MFYSQFILAKKGPLGTIWIAAHLERKLKKNQVADTDIGDSVDSILFPDVPIALRLSSHLLLGVVRIYSKKVNYLFHDCSETLLKVKQAFRSTAVDLPPEESTAPYHSITLPETFDLDDFELPDTVGNFDDRNVSTKEQITLQDALDGAGFSNLQFGLDERFGDEDVSQIGLDFEEDFLRDSNLMFQQVKEGVFQHGEGPSESMKINDSEEQASHDKENNDADSELSKLLGVDRGKNVITNFQNVNKSDELSHRLMFNIRTPDLNEVFMPDNGCIGGPSGTHDIDMDPTSPEFNEPNNLPITPMAKEVAMVQEAECVDVANGNILNESPITPMVQEVKCAKEANEDIPKATLTIPESNIVVMNEPNCTLDELPTTHMVQEVQSADAANDNIQNAISTNLESDNYVLNDPANILDDSKNAENASIPMPTNVTDPKLADEHVVLQFSDSAVATPGLVDKEPDLVAASALPSGVVCSEESSHVVSSRNGIPTLNHPQIGDVNSVQTNHISFLNTDIHMKSCTSVSNQANLVPPGEPYYSVTPAVDKSIQSREPTVSIQGPPSAIAINTNTEAQPKLNDVQPDQLKHLPSSEAPEPEKLFFTPAVNVTSSNDQNMHLSQGLPSDIAIDTNMEAQPKLNDGQLDQLNCLPSSEAPEPERLLFTPAVNITPSIDQNMHFSQGPPDVAVNTNMEAQPKLNDVQLDQLNHLPSSEAPEPERLLFTPAVNFTPSNDQNMHFSQGPPSNIAINTNMEAQPKLDDVRLDQLNHLPSSEAPEPERVLFTPAVNFTPSNDQNMHFSQGMHFAQGMQFNQGMHSSQGMQFSQDMHSSRGIQFSQDMHFRGPSTNMHDFSSDNATVTNREKFVQEKSNEHINQLNYVSNSQFSEPERMLFTPSVNHFAPNNIEKQPANKNVIDFDESVDRTGTLSGKKRPLTDSTPYILNDASFNMSSVLQKRQHNDYIIPQDDDLLASILVGRTPALKVGPSPPIPKPPTSKRPRLTQKSGLPKRRKVLLDDPIVLHADTIRQQLINTDDIRRLRKKVPCTIPEILRLQRNLLEEGEEEKDIFGGSMFTGISQKLISLNTRKYVFAQKLSQHRINHDPTIEVIKEFGGNKSPVSVMDNNGPETVTPSIAQLEKVNASEIVTPNVEVAERINASEVVTSNVEALERIHVSEIVTPNVEVSEKINMSEIVTHAEVSDGVNVTEIVTPNVEVSERVNVSDVVTPVVEVSEGVDRPELIDTENCNNHFSIATQEPHTVDIPEIETSNAEFGDTVIEKKCDVLSNDLLLGAPDMPVTVNDNMPHQSDLSNDKATEITVEDMAVDVVNMAEVGSEFKEYASYIVGEANSLDPDLCIIEREHAASAMDENLSVNAEAGLDVGNDHMGHEPTKDSNENLSVNIETGLHVESNHIEQAGTKESDENSSLNVQTGLDVESNHIELAATKESDEFDDDIDNIDTDFLNVDDDVEYDEDTTTDVQNAEDTQTLETAGWSSRTRGVANYLKIMFDQESGRGRKSVAIDQLLAGKTRKEASRMFFETLVLKTRDYIQVEQETPFAYINVQPRTKLLKSEF